MKGYLILMFLLIIPIVYSDNECDWEVEIISNNIFENRDDFSFRYFINRIDDNERNRMNVILNRTIEDIYGNIIRSYNLKTEKDILNYRTTFPPLSPNLDEGVYLIRGEIFPDCNDTELENNIDYKLIIILPEPLDQDYTNLKITEFLPNPEGHDDAPLPEGEWVELYNEGDSSINLEGLILNDDYGNGLEISNTNILQNNTIIQPYNYLTIYRNRNGRLTLNNEGLSKVQLFYEDILLDEVSYSSSIEGLSWSKVNNNWILSFPSPSKENILEEPDYSSFVEINKVYLGSDDKAKFGESIRVKVVVYRGDTSKYNIDLYIVDENNNQVSKRSEVNIENKFTNNTLIIPVQLEPNCKAKYNNGTYNIVLKGLEDKDTEEIEIKGITKSLCEIIKLKEKASSEKASESINPTTSEIEEETQTYPLTSSLLYQSSDIKARNIGIYFFCAVLLLLIIYLIFKKTL